jgi:hypothetical protein
MEELTMTRKHFVELANSLKTVKNLNDEVLNAIISFCKSQNYNFNEDVFRGYIKGTCGQHGGNIK